MYFSCLYTALMLTMCTLQSLYYYYFNTGYHQFFMHVSRTNSAHMLIQLSHAGTELKGLHNYIMKHFSSPCWSIILIL